MVARSSSPRHSSTTQRSSSITKVWLGFVLLLVIWQPLKLGFYMDDWPVVAGAAHQGSAFSGKRFHYIVGVDPSRPGLVLPRFVLSSLLGDNAFSWQSAMLLANIAVAVCIASAARAITGIGSRWAALAFGSAWLLLPWSTSNQFWTVLLPVELLVALYALLLASAIRKQPQSIAVFLIQALTYFWICTGYEVFYGQFVAVALVASGLLVLRRLEMRTAVSSVISLGAAQVLALLWYFESQKLMGSPRSIEHNWIETAETNLVGIIPQMAISMEEMRWQLCLAILTLIIFSGSMLWRSRRKWGATRNIYGAALIVIAAPVGAVLSVVCLSMGGRPFSGLGADNRTFILISFWLVLLITIAGMVVDRFLNSTWRRILIGMALASGVCLGAAHTFRTLDWADAWSRQKEILKAVPVEQMSKTEPDASIILINTLTIKGAPIFAASWDINTALPLSYPVLEGHRITIYSAWLGPMSWDGEQLRYDVKHPIAKTRNVYLWTPVDHSFHRAMHPFEIETDLRIRFLR
jgi:hypothetical protein